MVEYRVGEGVDMEGYRRKLKRMLKNRWRRASESARAVYERAKERPFMGLPDLVGVYTRLSQIVYGYGWEGKALEGRTPHEQVEEVWQRIEARLPEVGRRIEELLQQDEIDSGVERAIILLEGVIASGKGRDAFMAEDAIEAKLNDM